MSDLAYRSVKDDLLENCVKRCEALRTENERQRAALKEIAYQYENQDLNHVDYRVLAKRVADSALEQSLTPKEG